ncbi:lytic murein transglycosylase [Chthonobacter rhizosphaerae]|uniref:lytic murein transglycosylase n=1 Tax=Chthonobacter rhizosphaerae TaxID=2735553 RepID=UPI0015EEC815|nr:lytic murein transglycosylase [Chthonobacter rhizosphaerae]
MHFKTATKLLFAAALSVAVSGCLSLGEPFGFDAASPVGEPPRSDGPIPPAFTAFVETLWPAASASGVSRRTFDAAFDGLGPDQSVIDAASRQAEFVKPIWEYLDGAVSETRVTTGREMLRAHAGTLERIEATYGVPRTVVVAVWGMESSYGAVLGNPKVVRNAVRALATLAWKGGKRARYGRQQLLAVLRILERGDTDPIHITGSWAGAMGHTQFIPTTYEAYAVDFDGDGRRNIWTSIPDALASTANYLRKAGWRSGETWGYEVVLPAGLGAADDTRRPIGDWRAAGVRRANGAPFPRDADQGRLYRPAGAAGPAFLLLHNFAVIKRYNNANSYALGVGHLSDRIAGGGPFVTPWPRDDRALTIPEREELQTLLARRGYDVGPIDGLIGTGTIESIRAYQAQAGLPADGSPSQELLDRLRTGR